MSNQLFDCMAEVSQSGYEWRMESGEPFLVPLDPRAERRRYDPLAETTALFREFADLSMSEDSILGFANMYGSMGRFLASHRPDILRKYGESRSQWFYKINEMKIAVGLWDMVQNKDSDGLARHIQWVSHDRVAFDSSAGFSLDEELAHLAWQREYRGLIAGCECGDLVEPARRIIWSCVAQNLGGDASVGIKSEPGVAEMQLCVRIAGLNDALWIQFAQAIQGNKSYGQCRTCGEWWELHPDVARTNKRTCSNACRSKVYRQRKTKARRMFADGIVINEIAERLDAEPSTVQKWISDRRRKP